MARLKCAGRELTWARRCAAGFHRAVSLSCCVPVPTACLCDSLSLPASPPHPARGLARVSGQRGACCHEASVSTGRWSPRRASMLGRASPQAAYLSGQRSRHGAPRCSGRSPQSGSPHVDRSGGATAPRPSRVDPRPRALRLPFRSGLSLPGEVGPKSGEGCATTLVPVSCVAIHLAPGRLRRPFKFSLSLLAARIACIS